MSVHSIRLCRLLLSLHTKKLQLFSALLRMAPWATFQNQRIRAILAKRSARCWKARSGCRRTCRRASRATGIPARFLVAQAALETGWGKFELKNADGSPSHNLFNIKAGKRWAGDTVSTATTEYSNGVATRENARFRSYGSYADSFRDYARLIGSNPRYAAVVGQDDATTFARGLQAAGYATDPNYADKLARIINGNTLRTALAASTTRLFPSRPIRTSGASAGGAASPAFRRSRSVDQLGRKSETTRVIARLQFEISTLARASAAMAGRGLRMPPSTSMRLPCMTGVNRLGIAAEARMAWCRQPS